MQAQGAAPSVEQAEQQERGPRQRGVSRRQVLAEGRHGTNQGERAGGGDAAATASAEEARGRLGGEDRAEKGGAGCAGPPPGARRRAARAPEPPVDFARRERARAPPRRHGPGTRSAQARTPAGSPETPGRAAALGPSAVFQACEA